MSADKSLTIREVESLRNDLNAGIAELIREYESATGLRVGYIDVVRTADRKEPTDAIMPFTEDRGDVITVDTNTNLEL